MNDPDSTSEIDEYLKSLISSNALPFTKKNSGRYLVTNSQSRFLWPGCIFDNISLSNNNEDPKTFTLSRAPITLSSSAPGVSKQTVETPTRSSVIEKVNEMLKFEGPQIVRYESFKSSTISDISFSLKFIAQGLVAAVEASGYAKKYSGMSKTCISLIIDSFALSIDDWKNPSDLFVGETLAQVKSSITSDSAPAIISQIHFGRILNIICSEVEENTSFESAIKATVEVIQKGTGEVEAKYKDLLNTTNICVVQSGVSEAYLPSGFNGLYQLLRKFCASSDTGSIIGLQLRNLDNSPCGIPAGLEYRVSDIYVKANQINYRNIKLFGVCEFDNDDIEGGIITCKFDFNDPESYGEKWIVIADKTKWHKLPFEGSETKTKKIFNEGNKFGFNTEFWDHYDGEPNRKIQKKSSPKRFDCKYQFIPGLAKGEVKRSPNVTYTLEGSGDSIEVSYHVCVRALENYD